MATRPPLPDRLRPRTLDDVVGQQRWLGLDAPLRQAIVAGRVRSMVFWGPPGCGKTTLARVIAGAVEARFVQLSAVLDGVKQIREVVDDAVRARALENRDTVVFVDEIHRWNKGQQDALLPHVEAGTLVLLGATTENPSFELNAALRSRLQIVRLDPLATDDVVNLLRRSLTHDEGLARPDLTVDDEVLTAIAESAAGDARRAMLDLERAADGVESGGHLTLDRARATLQRSDLRHDKSGDDHYDVVSAMIKSMRGSDPDAAVYWLARLIAAGEDVRFIARRLVIFASEDVGNADPRALAVANDAATAVNWIGFPEGRIVLAQAAVWLACCPKSNASYKAINAALEDVERYGALPVPFHLRNAVTADMKAEGFGKGYLYPHDHPNRIVRQQYRPAEVAHRRYYEPSGLGDEKVIAERLKWWKSKLEGN